MSNADFQAYSRAIPAVRAREMLSEITVASFPHMNQENQRKEHRKIFNLAYPDGAKAKKPMSLVDLAKVLKNG